MKPPELPPDEAARVAALRALDILDTAPEERFDRVTRLAKRLFGVPIALVSLVDTDRQWFKAREGLDARQTSREISFCGHAILDPSQALVVPDAIADDRFRDNPLVQGDPSIRFYAGMPIRVDGEHAVGTLCLIDRQPRELSAEERALLRDLASIVEEELTVRRQATTDELTGLRNRRGFVAIVRHCLAQCQRLGEPATLLFFDLDKFKAINDTFGHAAGDAALRLFAQGLRRSFREADVVARLGGDEFCVFALGHESRMGAPLRRLEQQLSTLTATQPFQIEHTAGMVAVDPARAATLDELMAKADERMYWLKPRVAPAPTAAASGSRRR